nr:TGACG-sequence-specific DNA-binding protein TGA-2.1 [Ipomoea batatas]
MGTNTRLNVGGEVNRSSPAGMPSFISQTPLSNPMGTEGNTAHTSQVSDFGVLEQYLGFRIGDGANVNQSNLFNSMPASNPSLVAGGSGILNKAIASSNASLPAAAPGSLALQLQKGPQTNQVPLSGANHEIWAERNMAGYCFFKYPCIYSSWK